MARRMHWLPSVPWGHFVVYRRVLILSIKAKQLLSEKGMVTSDSESSGIKPWVTPVRVLDEGEGNLEWIMEEGDDEY